MPAYRSKWKHLSPVYAYPDIFNPQLFLSGFKNFPAKTYRIQIEFSCPHKSYGIRIHSNTQGSSAIKYLQSMRHRETRPARCATILVYCSVRDWTRFCYVIELENIPIHPSTRHWIRYGFVFSTLESGFENIRIRCRIRRMRCTEAVSRKKKLRIQKFLATKVWS